MQCGAFLFVIQKNRHPLHKGAGLLSHAIYYALGRIASRSGPLDTMVILWPISCSMKAT